MNFLLWIIIIGFAIIILAIIFGLAGAVKLKSRAKSNPRTMLMEYGNHLNNYYRCIKYGRVSSADQERALRIARALNGIVSNDLLEEFGYTLSFDNDLKMLAEKDIKSHSSTVEGQIQFLNNFADSLKYKPTPPEKEKSVVGQAVAGGIIAGPAGAVVGALNAVDKNNKIRSEKNK